MSAKQTKQQKIDYLTDLLNLRSAELEQSISREKSMYTVLGGRYGGETPSQCAERVMLKQRQLAYELDSALNKINALKKDNDRYYAEVYSLRTQLRTVSEVLRGASNIASAHELPNEALAR